MVWTGSSLRFQWVSNDGSADTDIAGATDSTYTLAADDEGKTIKVRVAFTDRGGYAESLTAVGTDEVASSAQANPAPMPEPAQNSPATGAPTITGTALVGETLTADTSGIADADGLANVSYSYQWISNDGTTDTDITGATDSTYTLVSGDEGDTIKVKVSFTDDRGNSETLTSAATIAVETPNSTSTIEISVTFTVEWEEIEEILAFEHTRVVIAVKGLPAVTAEYHFSSDFLDDQGANAYYCIQGPLGERVGTTPDTDPQETHVLYKETNRSPYSTYIPKGCTPGSYKLVTTWRNLDGSDTGSTEYAIDVAENPAVEQVAYVEPTYPDSPNINRLPVPISTF